MLSQNSAEYVGFSSLIQVRIFIGVQANSLLIDICLLLSISFTLSLCSFACLTHAMAFVVMQMTLMGTTNGPIALVNKDASASCMKQRSDKAGTASNSAHGYDKHVRCFILPV